MKMFKDDYDEDYDSIEEYERGVKLFHMDDDYNDRHDYERGIKPFNDDDDCYQDDCDSCIKHFKD